MALCASLRQPLQEGLRLEQADALLLRGTVEDDVLKAKFLHLCDPEEVAGVFYHLDWRVELSR